FVLPLGILILGAVLVANQRRGFGRLSSTLPVVLGAIVGGTILAVLGGTENTWGELYEKDIRKLSMVLWARPMVSDHPFWGIGRGAFESVFPAYRSAPGDGVYSYAECFPAQWLAEWGVPVGIAMLAGLIWILLPRRLDITRSTTAAAAWSGVLILLLQN